MLVLNRFNMIIRARHLVKTLGARCAAGYLRNRAFSLNEALLSLGMPIRFTE